jgi:outer membrane protein assembly factor BamB
MSIRMEIRMSWAFALLAVAAAATLPAEAQWPQWGGPQRNFTAASKPLADKWPEGGPRQLWKRELGDGYSSLICDDGVLYTMYRKLPTDTTEYTVALNATTGATLWEQAHPAPVADPPDQRWGGNGPNSTPLVVEDRLYSVGSCRVLRCFEKKTGKLLWEHDLIKEFGAPTDRGAGYSPSPIAYKNLIILAIDKGEPPRTTNEPEHEPAVDVPHEMRPHVEGRMLLAFDRLTGKPAWNNLDFDFDFSSPILIRFADRDQLVGSGPGGVFAVDPANGDLLWHHPKRGGVPTPLWDGVDSLLFSSQGESLIQLTKEGDRIVPVERWRERKLDFIQATPIRVGDIVVGSSQQNLLGADWKTGKRLWLKRGYPFATLIVADGKVLSMDQDGNLKLLRVSREGLEVLGECKPLERYSFATPALSGDTLYLRDRKNILALDLGQPQQAQAQP